MNKPQIIYKLFRNSIFEIDASKEAERARTDQLFGLSYLLFFLELEMRCKTNKGEQLPFQFSEGFSVVNRIKDFPFFEIAQLLSYIKLEVTGLDALEISMDENDLYGNDYAHVLDNIIASKYDYLTLFSFTVEELFHRKYPNNKGKIEFEKEVLPKILEIADFEIQPQTPLLWLSESYTNTPLISTVHHQKLMTKDKRYGELIYMSQYLLQLHGNFEKEVTDVLKVEEEQTSEAIIALYPPLAEDHNEISISLASERVKYNLDEGSTDWYIIDTVQRLLKEGGKAIVGVSSSFLERKNLQKFRSNFIASTVQLQVFDLGKDYLSDFKVDTLLVFEKSEKTIEKVLFSAVDEEYSLRSVTVDVAELKQNDYNLSPKRYLLNSPVEEEEYFVLKEILKKVEFSIKGEFFEKYIQVQPKDLSESFLNYEINIEELEEKYWVDEETILHDDLFICNLNHLKNNQLQYCWMAQQEDIGVIQDGALQYYILEQNKVYLPYLIHELHSDSFLEQLNAFSKGSLIKTISSDDFLNIKIPKISLHDQKLKVVGFREAYVHSKAKEIGLEKANMELKEDFYKEYRSLRHNIGHLLSSIQSSIEVIGNVLEFGDYNLDLNTVINKKREVTFGDQVSKIKKSSGDIYNWLRSFEDQLRQDYPLEKVPVHELKLFLQKRYASRKEFDFQWGRQEDKVDVDIYLHKDGFVKVMDNIVQNALHHGFVEPRNHYAIKVGFKLIQKERTTTICIAVSNNGQPFPEDFDFKALVERGQTSKRKSNTGLGGNDIYRTMKAMKGDFDLYLDRNNEYSVSYKLFFACDVRNKSTVSR
ncbi:hypothetical protein [Flammeovirga aprica]|uniref:Uncharacterized protein n=1 Tax=Flammeovirga aprica JL-4 TaxID=694437 RepID=A0A7X9RZ24_9BACT|nr:hypothetical protein [Flammeovirga aprica]NME71331.1 hypothetical protein [Flammeovirga aprica JL-4]